MKIKMFLLSAICLMIFVAVGLARTKRAKNAAAPEQTVKNLYAAKGAASPFFQKKNRALIRNSPI